MKRFLFLFLLIISLFACKKTGITSLVFVNKPADNIMMVGDTFQMEVLIYPMEQAQSASVKWTSSDGTIASVDDNGLIVALSAGKVLIRAVAGDAYADCEIVVDAGKANFNFPSATAYYYSNIYDLGTKNFALRLFESTITSDENGNLSGEGFIINFSLNLDTDEQKISNGTYKLSETGESLSFFPGSFSTSSNEYGSYLGQLKDNTLSILPIKDGKLEIEKEENNYKITFSLTGERGEILTGNFNGEIAYFDKSEENLVKKNYVFSDVEKKIDSQNNQINLQLRNGNDTLKLNVNLPPASNELLPNKTYEVSAENTIFSIEKGSLDNGVQKGSWLCCENEAFPIESGKIIYTKTKKLEITLYSTEIKITSSVSVNF